MKHLRRVRFNGQGPCYAFFLLAKIRLFLLCFLLIYFLFFKYIFDAQLAICMSKTRATSFVHQIIPEISFSVCFAHDMYLVFSRLSDLFKHFVAVAVEFVSDECIELM